MGTGTDRLGGLLAWDTPAVLREQAVLWPQSSQLCNGAAARLPPQGAVRMDSVKVLGAWTVLGGRSWARVQGGPSRG